MKLKIEKEEYKNKTFKLNKKLLEQMEKVCEENQISLNNLVARCIGYALEHLDKEDQDN